MFFFANFCVSVSRVGDIKAKNNTIFLNISHEDDNEQVFLKTKNSLNSLLSHW